jgi:hypothetical protein
VPPAAKLPEDQKNLMPVMTDVESKILVVPEEVYDPGPALLATTYNPIAAFPETVLFALFIYKSQLKDVLANAAIFACPDPI